MPKSVNRRRRSGAQAFANHLPTGRRAGRGAAPGFDRVCDAETATVEGKPSKTASPWVPPAWN